MDDEYEKFERNNCSGNNRNSIIEGVQLTAIEYIRVGEEIRLDYRNRREVGKIARVGKFVKCKSNT